MKLKRSQAVKDGMTDAQIRATYEGIISDRPYRTPRGFTPWEEIAGVMAIGMSLQPRPNAIGKDGQLDRATALHIHRSWVWLCNNNPAYLVRNELLSQLDNTDVPFGTGILKDIEMPPIVLLLFPQGRLVSPCGGCIDWAIAIMSDLNQRHLVSGSYRETTVPFIGHEKNYPRSFDWSSVDSRCTTWFSGASVDHDGSIIIQKESQPIGATDITDDDRIFTNRVRMICLQAMMAIATQPASMSSTNLTQPIPIRGPRPTETKRKFWTPREILLAPREISPGKPQGKHAPPRLHWRRGHWRNQPIGRGRTTTKLIWVRPSLIRGTLESNSS